MSNNTTSHAIDKQAFEQSLLDYSLTAKTALRSKGSWMAYGAAASTALLAGSGIEAAIIYSGPQNITLAPPAGTTAVTYIDMDGGGNDFAFRAFSSPGSAAGSAICRWPWCYGQMMSSQAARWVSWCRWSRSMDLSSGRASPVRWWRGLLRPSAS